MDADIKSDTDVKRGAGINVRHMLDQTMRDAKVKLVFLDACRDNPFVTAASPGSATRSDGVQSGLARMEPGTGTLIAYATGLGRTALDGQKGVNSPFTRALVDNITRPGVEIRQAMNEVRAEVDRETNQRQLPWDQTNLTGAVYLNPVPAANATARASDAAAVSTGGASDVELQFWRSIRQTNTPARLNAYLDHFPAGHFKSLALARLAALETGPSATTRNLSGGPDPATFTADATEATEEQIGLSRTQRRDVQRRLTRLGFDTKVTGKFDPTTRAVITRWQEARGYPATGFLNTLQHKALLAEIITTTNSGANTDFDDKPTRHHRGGGRRHHGGGPLSGPGRFIGGVVGGLFR